MKIEKLHSRTPHDLRLYSGHRGNLKTTVGVLSRQAARPPNGTASSTDYSRCQQMIAEQRRAGRVVVGYSETAIIADSQAGCASYGVLRPSAQFDRCVEDEFAARRPG